MDSKNTCKQCGKAFCDKSTLNKHFRRIHMKENDPKMNTRCGKLLTSIHLARHVADCRTCNGLLINNPDT